MNSVEGKGIEMIRTDQCEYIRQLSEDFLTRVFTSSSLSQVQTYESLDIDDFQVYSERISKDSDLSNPNSGFHFMERSEIGFLQNEIVEFR